MKILLLFIIGYGLSAAALEYQCSSKKNEKASLLVDVYTHQIQWVPQRGRVSAGQLIGVERAPYSPWKGSSLFRLTQWPWSADSSWLVAIDFKSVSTPAVVVYFDHDDHPENETPFQCNRTR